MQWAGRRSTLQRVGPTRRGACRDQDRTARAPSSGFLGHEARGRVDVRAVNRTAHLAEKARRARSPDSEDSEDSEEDLAERDRKQRKRGQERQRARARVQQSPRVQSSVYTIKASEGRSESDQAESRRLRRRSGGGARSSNHSTAPSGTRSRWARSYWCACSARRPRRPPSADLALHLPLPRPIRDQDLEAPSLLAFASLVPLGVLAVSLVVPAAARLALPARWTRAVVALVSAPAGGIHSQPTSPELEGTRRDDKVWTLLGVGLAEATAWTTAAVWAAIRVGRSRAGGDDEWWAVAALAGIALSWVCTPSLS